MEFNAAPPQFKVQRSSAAVQRAFGPVQGSRFKVGAALNCGGDALNWPKAVEL